MEQDETRQQKMERAHRSRRNWIVAGVAIFILICGGLAAGIPHYGVWQQDLAGRARLAEAKHSRMITIEEAKAAEESAKHMAAAKFARAKGDAAAEHERAKGVALSIEEIGNKLQDYPEYLHYRWVEGLHDGTSEVIYIPTEANMPLLEARPRPRPK